MKNNLFLLGLMLLITSCGGPSNFVKFGSSVRYYFQENDEIYYVNLEPDCVYFYASEDEKLFSDYIGTVDLGRYKVDHKYCIDDDERIFDIENEKLKKDENFIDTLVNQYNNNFSEKISGKGWTLAAKTPPVQLKLNSINYEEVMKLGVKEFDYNGEGENLKLPILKPEDVSTFCDKFAKKYPNAKYVMLQKDMHLFYKLLDNIDTDDPKSMMPGIGIGIPLGGGPVSVSPTISSGNGSSLLSLFSSDIEGRIIVPKTIIDIKRKMIVAIDTRIYTVDDLRDLQNEILERSEIEAKYYNKRF